MEGDPTGVAAAPAAADTAATADVALAASEPTAEATRAAEGQQGESASDSTTPPGDAPAEDSVETDGTDSESESEDDQPDDQPRNDEERKLSRRERQRLREQERIDKAIADALAAKEREAQQAEEARKRQEQAEAAEQARRERLAKFVGTPETVQSLASEVEQLNAQIRRELVTPTPGTDLDALIEQANAKTAELSRIRENQTFEGEIRQDIWSQIEGDFAYPTTFPELADPRAKAAYLHAQGGVRGALDTLANAIRSHKDTEWQAKLDAQAKDFQSKLKAVEADRDGWRVRAGGGSVGVEQAGAPSYPAGTLTPERYAAMDSSERAKLRSTPEGRAQIDAMTRRARGAA